MGYDKSVSAVKQLNGVKISDGKMVLIFQALLLTIMMEIILITNFMIVLTINQVIQRQRSIQAMLQQVLFNQEQYK